MSASVEALQAALDRARNGPAFELYRLGGQTDEQRAVQLDAEREEKAKPAPPVADQLGAAMELDSYTQGITKVAVERSELETDPNYVPPAFDSPEFKTLMDGVSPEYWPKLASARSAQHAQFLKSQIAEELGATAKLEEGGWTGTALRIGVSVLDPVSLSAMVLSGGSSLLMSGGRAARAAKLAAAGSAENFGLETALYGTRETKNADDLMVALIGGAVAGGAIGSLLPAASRAKLYETGNDLMAGGTGPGKVATDVNIELDEQLSVGSAQASRGVRELSTEQLSPEVLSAPQLKGVEAKLRFDWYGQLAKSENPAVRDLGRKLLEDPVGERGVAQAGSAEEFASVLKKRSLTYFYRDANPALDEYLRGTPLRERGDATNRFFEEVTAAVRAEDFSSPTVGRAAQSMQRAIKTAAEEAKRFGVKGFEDLDLTDGYVPRIPSAQKIDQLMQRFGTDQIEKLLAESFARAAE
jgi:hypothetical protein